MKIKKIQTKLNLISMFTICMTSLLAIGLMYWGSTIAIDRVIENETNNALMSLINDTENLKIKAAAASTTIIKNGNIKKAMEGGNKNVVYAALNLAFNDLETKPDYITIYDNKGNVLASLGAQKSGEALDSQMGVKAALAGNAAAYTEPAGTEIKMAALATAPVKSISGQTIGAVSTGYRLDDPDYLDGLKASTGTDYTVFLNNERINTTIVRDGQRQTGTTLAEKISSVVLQDKQDYSAVADVLGESYYTAYRPILNSQGDAIGVFFTGKPIADIKLTQLKFLLLAVAANILLGIGIIVFSVRILKKIIVQPVTQMASLAIDLSEGSLRNEQKIYDSEDEIGQLGRAMGSTAESLRLYINDISDNLNRMAKGDLSAEITADYRGDFAPIKQAMIQISDALNETLARINNASEQVASGADQVAGGAQALSQGATEQASSIQELTASITEVSGEVSRNASNVRAATEYMEQAASGVETSNHEMKKMLEAMGEINTTSNQIGKIIKVIDDIAFQTNILALNAAVEAARAGMAGKGFAVVADEVRNLAIKSADAAKQTTALIENSIKAVHEGSRFAEKTAQSLNDVSVRANKVKDIMNMIDQASEGQAQAISQISRGIEQISAVVQNNSATAEESAAASQQLSAQAAMLNEEVNKFKLAEKELRIQEFPAPEILDQKASGSDECSAEETQANTKYQDLKFPALQLGEA
jgi:methyl-accepting chemotaxis protein